MAQDTGVREHAIAQDTFHYKWDNSLPPAVEISSRGSLVHFDTEEVTSGQLKQGDPASNPSRTSTSTSCTRSAAQSLSKAPNRVTSSKSRSSA